MQETELSAAMPPDEMERQRTAAPAEPTYYPLSFRGTAAEYFNIWVVNITLSILTLGIYSAWAKVRTQRYFYGNTYVNDSCFDYLADPVAILKGRLLAVAFFLVYWIGVNFVPILAVISIVAFVILFPWIISRSMMFRARNSAYRNIRFNFTGRYWDAMKAFMLWPILIPFTLGLIWPYVQYKQKRMLVEHSSFGAGQFEFSAQPKEFYVIYVIAVLLAAGLPIAVMIIGVFMGMGGMAGLKGAELGLWAMLIPLLIMLPLFLVQYLVYVYVQTRVTNLVYNNSHLGRGRLDSRLQVRALMWIYFTNTLAIMVSIGLLIPWAKVRLARYRAEHTYFVSEQDMEHFLAGHFDELSALGEEATEIFDMDVSI